MFLLLLFSSLAQVDFQKEVFVLFSQKILEGIPLNL
jgi:hypothetical protein